MLSATLLFLVITLEASISNTTSSVIVFNSAVACRLQQNSANGTFRFYWDGNNIVTSAISAQCQNKRITYKITTVYNPTATRYANARLRIYDDDEQLSNVSTGFTSDYMINQIRLYNTEKIYSLSVDEDNIYIPCTRDRDNVDGLYDIVNDIFTAVT